MGVRLTLLGTGEKGLEGVCEGERRRAGFHPGPQVPAYAHDSIWQELLVHAKADRVMRWGVLSPQCSILISSC